jgi:hypothetical protein
LTIRPDLIIHEPFEPSRHAGRDDGNHAVIELKRRSDEANAIAAFSNIEAMLRILDYPIGVFINIDSQDTFTELVPREFGERVVCIAVALDASGTVSLIERRA